jgi:CheY-like chemotaxis protein
MGKHILCADDSATMQQVVAITFAGTEFEVHAAKSADEALAMAKQTPMDLVLADAVMPGKSGYELCEALKGNPGTKNVPVVLLCGNSQPFDEAKGKQVGADGSVVKPWDSQVMLDRVNEILAKAKQGVAAPGKAAAVAAPSPAAAAAASRPATSPADKDKRSATIMGMPAVAQPPAGAPAPTPTPMPVRAQPAGSPISSVTAKAPAAAAARPAPSAPAAASPSPSTDGNRVPMIKSAIPDIAAGKIAHAATSALSAAGHDTSSLDHKLLAAMAREIIERIAWEVVPELAETLIKQQLAAAK